MQGMIVGEINTEITSALMNSLGAAMASVSDGYASAGVAAEGDSGADMLRLAFLGGFLSCGGRVRDFGSQQLETSRAAAALYHLEWFLHIESKNSLAKLTILDEAGNPICTELLKKLEKMLWRRQFSYCSVGRIAKIERVEHFEEVYIRYLSRSIRHPGPKILAVTADEAFACTLKKLPLSITVIKSVQTEALKNIIADLKCDFAVLDGTRLSFADSVHGKLPPGTVYAMFSKISVNNTPVSPAFLLSATKIYAILALCTHLANTGQTFAEAVQNVPKRYVHRDVIECGANEQKKLFGAILRDTSLHPILEDGGIRIGCDKGSVTIVPDLYLPVYNIVAESANEEYCAELCADIKEKIGKIMEKN